MHSDAPASIYYALMVIILLVGSVVSIRSRASRQLIDDQTKRLELLEKNDQDKGEEIKHLQGQVDVLKTLPLKGIDKSLKLITEYMSSHDQEISNAKREIIDALRSK